MLALRQPFYYQPFRKLHGCITTVNHKLSYKKTSKTPPPMICAEIYKHDVFNYQCACGTCIHSTALLSVTSFISKYSFTSYHYTPFRFHFMRTPQHRTAQISFLISTSQATFIRTLPKPFSNAIPMVCFYFLRRVHPN